MAARKQMRVVHPIAPVFDENSRILILGSFPSVKSREMMFFYGHPRNRFWKVTAAVFGRKIPSTVEEKRAFLLDNRIAVWDVIGECEITGSSDASIRNVKANDLSQILNRTKIKQIYVNGKTAEKMFRKYMEKHIGRECIVLPSTSPANAAWSLDRLIDAWSIIKDENNQ